MENKILRDKKGRWIKGTKSWFGNVPWFKREGKKHPLLGKHRSEETKAKLRKANLGKKYSLETKKKLSIIMTKIRSAKKLPLIEKKCLCGKEFTTTRYENNDCCSKKCGYILRGLRDRGNKRSNSWKLNISKAHKGMKKPWMKKIIMERMKNLRSPTSIEKRVYDELKNRGLLFETQKLINGHFMVDAYIPKLNLIIECDGEYWHNLPKTIKRDRAKNAYLKKCGYNLLRLSETEINNGSFINRLFN